MINRRDVLKAAATSVLAGTASAQDPVGMGPAVGPFDQPTAKFDKAKQDQLPAWAFQDALAIPLVARPVAIGTYKELTKDGAKPFGDVDPVPLGESFHGIAREWGETPEHWRVFGCDPALTGLAAWENKKANFGFIPSLEKGQEDICNWGHFPIKVYKIPIVEARRHLAHSTFPAKIYGFAGMLPGPSIKMRLGQPAVVRFQNHLETEISVHLHGGHSPSHSDGFPSFYVLQGKSRDYFYPNILPIKREDQGDRGQQASDELNAPKVGGRPKSPAGYVTDVGEGQSTMWYHDHGMDATSYNVAKGMAGFAPCYGQIELKLIRDGVLPGLGKDSCFDPDLMGLSPDPDLEDPHQPGFYRPGKEPYHNPYDIQIVLQDKVIDPVTGQITFDNDAHNGYLGDTFFLNGVAWPHFKAENRKYRFRFLDGSSSRIYRLRFLSEADFFRLRKEGPDVAAEADVEAPAGTVDRRSRNYDQIAKKFLRIGKDTWLWSRGVEKTSVTIAMANRADLVIDFKELAPDLKPGEEAVFYLVNTMPQFNGRGPSAVLADGGDPRILPLPFDTVATPDGAVPTTTVAELDRPIGLMKIIVQGPPVKKDACIDANTILNPHEAIRDDEVSVVREFIFQRGKGAWQVNGRFYDPTVANATPTLGSVEEWVLRNGGGGWWHPIHIHLESHQLISYEKDFAADAIVDPQDPPALPRLAKLRQVADQIGPVELRGLHDTQILGPNTVARIRMRFRTWNGPFVFHCHNLDHEDMRMMHNFEPVPRHQDNTRVDDRTLANVAPDARTHGNDMTLQPPLLPGDLKIGELPWEIAPVPQTPLRDAGENQIPPRPREEAGQGPASRVPSTPPGQGPNS